ncbi:MAG: YbaB/EbfC family nucleoid-associated protein [Anaerolineae bacterium]|nr:YbaB/EbfC family nucleoid-associated protein [Anaerolineae bacterium]
MAKGKRHGGSPRRVTLPGRAPGGGDMMAQLQKLQEEMLQVQEALGEETVEVSVGGGAVVVVMTGHQRLRSVKIDPAVVDPQDVEMLQDLIVAAVNEAIEKSQSLAAERLGALTGGLGLPGLL